jgi:hypothetical protein
MKTLFTILLILILVSFMGFLYWMLFVKRKSRLHADQKLKYFEGLLQKLNAGDILMPQDVMTLAENPSTRYALYGILKNFGRTEIFPAAYFTLEKSAECFLVDWLEFPTELNGPPDRIKLSTKVDLLEHGEALEYFVFEYRKNEPPPGLPKAWMLGVAGPFTSESRPFDIPPRIFSRFNVSGTISPTEEARWVHEHINRK